MPHRGGSDLTSTERYRGHRGQMTSLPAPFAIRVHRHVGAAVRVEVVGELDLSTAPELEHALHREIAAGNEVVLDLGAVTFIDSTGLHTIVCALRLTEEAEPAF